MNSVEKWLTSNTSQLERVLSDYSDAHAYHGRRHKREFALSDLGLCYAVGSGRIELPETYTVRCFEVKKPHTKKPVFPHYAGYNGNHILDLISGQFFRDDANKISGIAIMLEKAPQLFYVLSNELTVLHATAEEIKQSLDLQYTLNND
jgi:hypothetical protein